MNNELYNLEEVYDDEIHPLMAQIIEICKKHEMPMLASFSYENDEEAGRGRCTTHLVFDNRHDDANGQACTIIKNGGHHFAAIAITTETP